MGLFRAMKHTKSGSQKKSSRKGINRTPKQIAASNRRKKK